MPEFDRFGARALEFTYRKFGYDCDLHPPAGVSVTGQRGIFQVQDVEENMEGAAIEAAVRGYALRLRTFLLPDGVRPGPGWRIELKDLRFDGYKWFEPSSAPKMFTRRAAQIIIPLTPVEDARIELPDSPPPGYNFGND